MQLDLDDIYNEVSASAFQSSFLPAAQIDTGSFGLISSSIIPDTDDKYDLGAIGKEWNDIFIDGTANIDSLAMETTVTAIKDEDDMSSDSATSLATQQSIKKYVDDNAGDSLTSVSSDIIPDGDNTRDLGSTTKEFKNLFIDGTANLDTANIGTANVTNLDTTTSITTKNFSTTGEFRISKVPTTFSGNGVLDARAQNYFIVANKSNINGIRGQIVTILTDGAVIAHHAENGVTATEQFKFALNRDLTFRGPIAHQFIYHKSRYWVRLA